MPFTCPECERPLYNRRREDCEFCGATLPDELRLDADQTAKLDEMKQREAKRAADARREDMLRDIQRADGGGFDVGF